MRTKIRDHVRRPLEHLHEHAAERQHHARDADAGIGALRGGDDRIDLARRQGVREQAGVLDPEDHGPDHRRARAGA
jgi:hypothetical protein